MALTKIDDRGLKTPVDLLDNEKIRFGTGNDLEIYHDGSNSIISDAGTGGLEIQSNGTGIYLQKSASEYLAKFLTDGAVELYNDNVKQVATTSTGLLMTGNAHGIELKSASANSGNFIKFSDHDTSDDGRIQYEHSTNEFLFKAEGSWRTRLGTTYLKPETTNVFDLGTDSQRFKDVYVSNDIDLLDDGKLLIGTGDDLQIYHDGSHSYIRDTGTGMLSIDGSQINLHNAAGSEYMLQAVENGSVSLYHDNSKKFETKDYGVFIDGHIQMDDSDIIKLGNGNDLQIYHDGTDSHIDNDTSNLRIKSNDVQLRDNAQNFYIDCNNGGSVDLYYDGTKKFETTSAGCKVSTGVLDFDDSVEARFGTGNDLKIYHDASDSWIQNNTGTLTIKSPSINIKTDSGNENSIVCVKDAGVSLYYNGTKKFETIDYGALIKRPSGGSTVLQIEGSEGNHATINMFADDGDNDNDKWQLDAQTGNAFVLYNYAAGSWEKSFLATGSGAFNIYHNNNKVIETHSAGIKVGVVGSTAEIWFPDSNDADVGLIRYRHDEDWMSFFTWGSERFRIEDNGDLLAHDTTIDNLSSDSRLKKNVADYNYDLAKFKQLRPRTLEWINTSNHEHPTGTRKGFIAQEVETVDASLTMEVLVDEANTADRALLDSDGKNKSTKLGSSDALYVSVIQQLITKIETLETKVAALEAK